MHFNLFFIVCDGKLILMPSYHKLGLFFMLFGKKIKNFLSAALFFRVLHGEKTYMQDLATVLRWMLILTQPGIESTISRLQEPSTDHQATTTVHCSVRK